MSHVVSVDYEMKEQIVGINGRHMLNKRNMLNHKTVILISDERRREKPYTLDLLPLLH